MDQDQEKPPTLKPDRQFWGVDENSRSIWSVCDIDPKTGENIYKKEYQGHRMADHEIERMEKEGLRFSNQS